MNAPQFPDKANPLSEQLLRDYAIVRLLGSGGMGEVYLAEQLRVGRRRVALKILNRACSGNPELVRRFENEAASGGRINHRNVVTVYESRVTDDGQMYVAMEYVEGSSLGQLLKTGALLPLSQIVEITRQVCAGLTAAHKLGIVHRDIKPDNIMLSQEDGEPVIKVLDFGIARLAETDEQGKTRAGVIMGTPGYMSPEQAMGKTADQIDARSDVYSLGMVVYQMLCGQVAFVGKSAMEVMRKHISEPPLAPSAQRPNLKISAAVEAVVLRALEKRREDRQQAVAEFASELEAAAAEWLETAASGALSEKDIPTVRIGLEDASPATAPFSSERLTNARQPRSTKDNLAPQKRPANRAAADAQGIASAPAPPADEAVRPLESPPRAIRSRPDEKQTGRKKALLAGGVLVALLLLSIYAITQLTGTSPPAHPALELRVKSEAQTGELDTLDEQNVVQSGKPFRFEIRLIDPGAVYLFEKSSADGYGDWQWLNPWGIGSEDAAVGEWQLFPLGSSLTLARADGAKTYVLVFVPQGSRWLPAEALQEQLRNRKISTENGVARLPAGSDVAESVRLSLASDTAELQAQSRRDGRNVTFSLRPTGKADSQRLAVYTVTVTAAP